MKKVGCHLVFLAVSFSLVGIASAQDKLVSSFQGMMTHDAMKAPFLMESEPKLQVGPNVELTGFLVDLVLPQQMWTTLDPIVPLWRSQQSVPPSLLPVLPLEPFDDAAVNHQADFVLLQLSFP